MVNESGICSDSVESRADRHNHPAVLHVQRRVRATKEAMRTLDLSGDLERGLERYSGIIEIRIAVEEQDVHSQQDKIYRSLLGLTVLTRSLSPYWIF